ncbi:hypothetical protein PVIIG_06030 [Plasmodium vivax India VII]|uniref:Variable surface protein n=3 Tax=Plasmodium vivax TaxID=5855 RepID=A0A0J9T3V3_PLAVI|nr:hypothetical protein PVIIG_06030 [Plasmodium vivax India VII]KMZ83211.1 hypothetical protein PVBG_05181 [Plasmodium vivax Brazil I]KMZ89779.1 hypothetical protein PVMG_04609 [Plasmodium vivax Mauritania I]
MSDNILDIRKWNYNYPFKNDVYFRYRQFDRDVLDDVNRSNFYVLCDSIIKDSNGDVNIHTEACVRLLRNLGYFSVVPSIYELKTERCNILFNWIYKFINEEKITHNIINKIFELYEHEMTRKNNYFRCHYERDIKINEPINITILDIFDNNTPMIIEALKNKSESIKAPSRMFVCECVKIYKKMNDAYCLNKKKEGEDYTKACSKLGHFKRMYDIFLYNLGNLSNSLPSLNYSDEEFSVKCPAEGQNIALKFVGAADQGDTSRMEISQDGEFHGPKSPDDSPAHSETVDSPMKKTITTTIGTVAGASSLLAFLYKVNTRINLNIRTVIYKCVYTQYT